MHQSAAPSVEAMLKEHGPFLHRLARALVGDSHLADDLVAETWAAALQTSASGQAIAEPRGWLATVLRRRARHEYRRAGSRRTESVTEEHLTGGKAPLDPSDGADVSIRMERERLLHDALQRLEDPYRTAVFLRYRDGLMPKEIAARAGVPVKSVASQISRGLAKVRTDLADTYGGGEEGKRAWLNAVGPLAVGSLTAPARAPRPTTMGRGPVLALGTAVTVAAVSAAGFLGGGRSAGSVVTPPAPTSLGSAKPSALLATASVGSSGLTLTRSPAVVPAATTATAPTIEINLRTRTGTPVGGRELLLYRSSGPGGTPAAAWTAVTGDDGRATFDWPGSQQFWVYDATRTVHYKNPFEWDERFNLPSSSLSLSLETAPKTTVEGRVLDSFGDPAPGATVYAEPEPRGGLWLPAAICDDAGAFRMEVGDDLLIQALAREHVPSRAFEVTRLAESAPGVRTVTLNLGGRGASLGGVVRDAAGEPVAGAWVVARTARDNSAPMDAGTRRPFSVVTGVDGRYEFPCELWARSYHLTASSPRHAASIQRVAAGNEPLTADFVLGPGATVRGRVLDPSGAPVPGAWVRYHDLDAINGHQLAAPSHGVATNEEGAYELRHFPRGDFTLRATQGHGMSPAHASALCSAGGSGTVPLDLTLSFEPRISGRVVDEAGVPVEGLWIRASIGQFTTYTYRIKTGPEGQFDLTALPDPPTQFSSGAAAWDLEFHTSLTGPGKPAAQVEDVEPGTTDLELVVVRPVTASAYVSGRLVRANGPVGTAATFFLAGAEKYGSLEDLKPDPIDGSFRVGPLPAGIYRVVAYDPNDDSVGKVGIELGEGEDLDLGSIDVGRGGRIALTLDVALPDAIPESLLPSLMDMQRFELRGPGSATVELEWKDGAFRGLHPAEPGTWRLHHRGGKRIVMSPVELAIPAGETLTQTLPARIGRRLSVNALMPSGDSWNVAKVRTYDSSGVELASSDERTPEDLDENDGLRLRVEVPLESVRVVLVIDGEETAQSVTISVPHFTESLDSVEFDARP